MKDWQFGYDIDYLKSIENKYKEYNSYSLSPFSVMKKNTVAKLLNDKSLIILNDDTLINISKSKVKSNINMFNNTILTNKESGDVTFSYLVGDTTLLTNEISKYVNDNCFLFCFSDDDKINKLAENNSFKKIGVKVSTFAEVINCWYRGKYDSVNLKYTTDDKVIDVHNADLVTVKKLNLPNFNPDLINEIYDTVVKLDLSYANHYSNYNKSKSWSAISLRGYSSDVNFIAKPSEMSKDWKSKNSDKPFYLQDTNIYNESFECVRKLITDNFTATPHRIRLMRLKPGSGELARHTDQVDVETGATIGRLARVHFPIKTNENVLFTNWDINGVGIETNMKVNECWYLDTRKPHRAINGGNEERIHLVIDFEVNQQLQDMICE